jgi:hypothetical protein
MVPPEIAVAEGTGSGNGETKESGGESNRASPKCPEEGAKWKLRKEEKRKKRSGGGPQYI